MYRDYFVITKRNKVLTAWLEGRPVLRTHQRNHIAFYRTVELWTDAVTLLAWRQARRNVRPMALVVVPPKREPEQVIVNDVATRLQDVISAVSALMQVNQLVLQGAANV